MNLPISSPSLEKSPTIPLVNLQRQYQTLAPKIQIAINAVLENQHFILGPCVKQFEEDFAALVGIPEVIGCSNGTSALSLALEACGITSGDEIITVSHTFIATVEAIYRVGAKPIFIDIDPETYTMDVEAIEARITPRTKAILPVHIYGTPCNMERIAEIAQAHKLVVIEDAAQAHLATYAGKPLGSMSHAACYSFYPGKNLGAYGDAGAVTTSHSHIAELVRKLRDHGRIAKYEHDEIGANERIDAIQAAILNVKLPYLSQWTAHRRSLARLYNTRLQSGGFKTMCAPKEGESVYHLFVTEVSNREQTMSALQAQGIHSGIHYPIPVHKQPALRKYVSDALLLPITEKAASRILSLPICGSTTLEEVDRVCDAFLKVALP